MAPPKSPPKSPLRLIANAIRRSLEPLLPTSPGGKKAWAKPDSKPLPTCQPQACTRFCGLGKPSSNKDWDPRSPGKDMASKASVVFSLGPQTARASQPSDLSPPDPAFRTHSLPNRPSKMFPALVSPPRHKIEDVPTLLEKVSLQETSDTSWVPKRRISVFSSLRLKDKSFESFLQESRQKKDLQDLVSTPEGKGLPVDNVQALEKLVQPLSLNCLGQRIHPPSERDMSKWVFPTKMYSSGGAVHFPY